MMILVVEHELVLENPFSIICIISLIFSFVLFFFTKWVFSGTGSKRNGPPSPLKLPIIGNFHQIIGKFPHRLLWELANKRNNDLLLLQLGSKPVLVVSTAQAAQEIMRTHDLAFSNRPTSEISRRLLYNNKDITVAPYGEYWRQLKSVCVLQLLSNKRVQSFSTIRDEETEQMVKKIEGHCCNSPSSPVNLSDMFMAVTNDVVCMAAFGRKYTGGGGGENGKNFKKMLRDLLELLGTVNVGVFFPWLSWVNHVNGIYAKVDRVAKEIDDFLEEVVAEHMDLLKDGESDDKQSFVDILLNLQKENSSGVIIDRDSIKAIILDIFAAGTHTTSTVLEWAMAELLRHPRVMNTLQNEVRQILKDKQKITEDDLQKMHYLKAVIKETLRYHPPIPLLVPREAIKDVKVMGYDVVAGTMVLTNTWAIGRDPNLWDEPEEFRPERFLNSSIDFKGNHFELIPFGAGRRGCPGISFAIATNELVLAKIMNKFDWGLPDGTKVEDLDMSESTGSTIQRRISLLAVATTPPCS